MREHQPGFSKAVSSMSGSRLLLSFGFTANVRPFAVHYFKHPSLTLSRQRDQARVSCGLSFLTLAPCTDSCYHSSGIIEDIMAQREAGMATMSYFYCDFRDEDKQNCRNLLLSILSQLCAQSDPCCDILAHIYSAHDGGTRKPSDDTLTKCLTKMVSLPD